MDQVEEMASSEILRLDYAIHSLKTRIRRLGASEVEKTRLLELLVVLNEILRKKYGGASREAVYAAIEALPKEDRRRVGERMNEAFSDLLERVLMESAAKREEAEEARDDA